MMDKASWLKAWLAMCVAGVLAAGCGTTGSEGEETLIPDTLPGDVALGKRFEGGTPVPRGEFNPENVLFAYDSYQIGPSEAAKVEKVAAFMRASRTVRLIVEGHCDERGSREYNMSLGEHRALAVRARLVNMGIDSARIQTRSYGEERPLDPGHNEAAWRANRRVEFGLYR